jgi:hypothetical protein
MEISFFEVCYCMNAVAFNSSFVASLQDAKKGGGANRYRGYRFVQFPANLWTSLRDKKKESHVLASKIKRVVFKCTNEIVNQLLNNHVPRGRLARCLRW